jgi:hypothetical protein
MTIVGCLQCRQWYDQAKPHLCGVLGDETARALEARLVALERRIEELESWRALANRPHGYQGGDDGSNERPSIAEAASAAGVPETAIKAAKTVLKDGALEEIEAVKTGKARLRFDRKANHWRYMRSGGRDRRARESLTRAWGKLR